MKKIKLNRGCQWGILFFFQIIVLDSKIEKKQSKKSIIGKLCKQQKVYICDSRI